MRGVMFLAVLGFLLLLLIILSHGRRLDESSSPRISENGLPDVVTLDDLFLLSEAHLRGRPLYHDLSQEEALSSNFVRRNAIVPDPPLDTDTTAENMTRVAFATAPALRFTAAPAEKVLTPFSLTGTRRLQDREPLGERYHGSQLTPGYHRSQFPKRQHRSQLTAGHNRSQFPKGHHSSQLPTSYHKSHFPAGYRRSQLPAGHHRSRFPVRYHMPQFQTRYYRSQGFEGHHRPTHPHSLQRLPPASLATLSNASVTHQPVGAQKTLPLPPDAQGQSVPFSRRNSTSQQSPADLVLHRRHPKTRHTALTAKRQWAAPWAVRMVGGGLMATVTLYLANLTGATLPWATHPRRTRHTQDPEVTEHMVEEAVRLWAAVEGREECRARALCRAGVLLGGLTGGSLLLVAAQSFLPREWEATVFLMAEGAILGSDCRGWRCGRDLSDDAKTS
ncbi:uncharacterized protein [Panulirus ornatus]|uniref:uncharacterized protein n=1 Tax=Panulirus ornatus TaxID=150431 RepID=UPI003A89CEBE